MRILFHALCAITIALVSLCGCTRGSNAEAPLISPEPVIDVGGAATATSLRCDTLDRSHWAAQSLAAVDGTVAHPSVWVDPPMSLAGRESEGEFPTRETVLAARDESGTGFGEGFLAPLRAVWGLVTGPFVAIFDDGSREQSPDRAYERVPVAVETDNAWRGAGPATSGE